MRIVSSTVAMAATRNYTAEATENQTTITRCYDGGEVKGTNVSSFTTKVSQFEAEGSAAVYTTSANGMERTDKHKLDHKHTASDPVEQGQAAQQPRLISIPSNRHWISDFLEDAEKTLEYLKRLIEYLNQCTGRSEGRTVRPRPRPAVDTRAFKVSAAQASARYQETVALISGASTGVGDANAAVINQAQAQGGLANGIWTRQTVQSGFVSGEEHTAFHSQGTVVTSDGRSINFNISLEMSRSFEAAYVVSGKEEIYTDPLVINMDTDAASLDDVSFYFDLNCDGVEEELSALDASSGFLALDKNGDGEINNGSELFGARTGDGFGELAAYDQDGNGWIDEGDEVYSQLKVWVKCGGSDAQLLSLSEADVGAIFLGSQNTQYSLTDSLGETGAMVRKTGLYLKESGQVGTVQHVDFKT